MCTEEAHLVQLAVVRDHLELMFGSWICFLLRVCTSRVTDRHNDMGVDDTSVTRVITGSTLHCCWGGDCRSPGSVDTERAGRELVRDDLSLG